MTPETIDGIVTIILAVMGALGGGFVSARLTKTNMELNYKQLFEDATIRANRQADKVDLHVEKLKEFTQESARTAIATAEREAKNAVALAALTAKLDLVESQRVEQEKRHAAEISTLNTRIAALETENSNVKKELVAAMSKLSKTERWVDLLQTRLNPPALSDTDTEAIQTLREKPPTSDLPKTGTEG